MEGKISATTKHIWMSPRKLRLVADIVRGQPAEEMLEVLPFVRKRAAEPIFKTLKSALANAEEKFEGDPSVLFIKEIRVDKGPIYKRFRPVSRGRAHGIQKISSHVYIELSPEDPKATRKGIGKETGLAKVAGAKGKKTTKSKKSKKSETKKRKTSKASEDKSKAGKKKPKARKKSSRKAKK